MVNLPDPRKEKLETAEAEKQFHTERYCDLAFVYKQNNCPPEVLERLFLTVQRIKREEELIKKLKKEMGIEEED